MTLLEFPPSLVLGGISFADEQSTESYRVAAYPVFLEHAKKGTSWDRFLADIGLSKRKQKTLKRSKRLSKEELRLVYERADQIRSKDLGR